MLANSHLNASKYLIMPYFKINQAKLSQEQHDRCIDCPLLGKIPEHQRQGKWTFVCCATGKAMTAIKVRTKASSKDKKHPLHRSCDGGIWRAWFDANPHHVFTIPLDRFIAWRQPYIESLGLKIDFPE